MQGCTVISWMLPFQLCLFGKFFLVDPVFHTMLNPVSVQSCRLCRSTDPLWFCTSWRCQIGYHQALPIFHYNGMQDFQQVAAATGCSCVNWCMQVNQAAVLLSFILLVLQLVQPVIFVSSTSSLVTTYPVLKYALSMSFYFLFSQHFQSHCLFCDFFVHYAGFSYSRNPYEFLVILMFTILFFTKTLITILYSPTSANPMEMYHHTMFLSAGNGKPARLTDITTEKKR